MTDKIITRQIVYNSSEYKQEIELRNRILKIPLGLNIYDLNLEEEIDDFHLGCFYENKLIAVLVLTKINDSKIQMRQVAVNELYQGRNIGKKLVEFSEIFLLQKGFSKIVLNARKNVVPFYEKLGYYSVGEEFIEVFIPHLRMEKKLK
ncbi:MAG: hypothetical protein A2033_12980 [Bacteroidetes bacterium GWA2_31_9]|nr:MAG: hypothetical protein A2033_12980 [Bacteroidetes bacterium GWA2_31_9]